jgi:hypothetical protein
VQNDEISPFAAAQLLLKNISGRKNNSLLLYLFLVKFYLSVVKFIPLGRQVLHSTFNSVSSRSSASSINSTSSSLRLIMNLG